MKKEDLLVMVQLELDALDQIRIWTKNLGKANKSFSTELRLKDDLTKPALMEVSKWLKDVVGPAMGKYLDIANRMTKDTWEYICLAKMEELRELKIFRKGVKGLQKAIKDRPKHVVIGRVKDDNDSDAEERDAGSSKAANEVD